MPKKRSLFLTERNVKWKDLIVKTKGCACRQVATALRRGRLALGSEK